MRKLFVLLCTFALLLSACGGQKSKEIKLAQVGRNVNLSLNEGVKFLRDAHDRKLIADLLPCLRQLAPLCEGLQDTVSLAYTDVYMADLAFHHNVKQAAKRGVPGSDTIYDDLKQRFPGRPKASPTPPAGP